MRKLTALASLCVLFLMTSSAYGQQFDIKFGLGTVSAPSSSSASGNYSPQSIGGGVYPAFSGDYLFFRKYFGVGAEVAWRASRKSYELTNPPTPFRPLYYDFNAVWAPRVEPHFAPDLMAGIGAESVRAYNGQISCSGLTGSCTNYTSTNHFMGHFGGGLRLYPKGNFFIEPEAHLYLIRHNYEFSSARATRYGVSIGYTFGGQ